MNKEFEQLNKLKLSWRKLKSKPGNEKIRIRDAAKKMNVSEAELLSTKMNNGVYFLKVLDYNLIFDNLLKNTDRLMFLVRNDFAVHEKNIISSKYSIFENKIINTESNVPLLEFNVDVFKYAFYEDKIHINKSLKSFQIFNVNGDSVLKIYLKGRASDEFEKICLANKVKYNYELQKNEKFPKYKEKVIKENFLVDRLFGFNDARDVSNLDKGTFRKILLICSEKKIPIQIHLINNECVQYHLDVVNNIVDYGPWLNVMDKGFNIHILEKSISKGYLHNYFVDKNKYYALHFVGLNSNYIIGISNTKGNSKDFINVLINLGVYDE